MTHQDYVERWTVQLTYQFTRLPVLNQFRNGLEMGEGQTVTVWSTEKLLPNYGMREIPDLAELLRRELEAHFMEVGRDQARQAFQQEVER